MNAELAALLRTAKETPDDDAPRLVIADWLDEHGEPARAELLRTQCHPDYRWHGIGAALPGLQRLFLARSHLGLADCEVIARHAPPTLTHLDLENNRLNDRAVVTLAVSERLAGLRVLDLTGNPLDDAGIMILATSPSMSNLRALDIRHALISAEAVDMLTRPEVFPNMRLLILGDRELSVDDRRRLVRRYGVALLIANPSAGRAALPKVFDPGDAS